MSHTHVVTDGAGHRWQTRQIINKVLPQRWMRMRAGHGTKGTREYDWAWLDVRADDSPDGHHENGTSILAPAGTDTPANSPSSAAGRRATSLSPSSWT
ncbi:hypothetical protein RCR19_35050 [Streptomyces sp. WAC07094]|uniref:hypothetical protein n=1 Tax=Streptomyces sp. WAC07094 TaxID=3072183 RepID=UPI002EA602F7|nr:hypothetical protein [Streptomyces sp. WAC07094]